MTRRSSIVIPPKIVEQPLRDVATELSLMLSFVATAYNFAQLLLAWREGHVDLAMPEEFPLTKKEFEKFKTESVDFREIDCDGDGTPDGMSFTNIAKLITANKGQMDKVVFSNDPDWDDNFVNKVHGGHDSRGVDFDSDRYYMATYRSIQHKVSCVYTVIKDKKEKRVIVSFRGSRPPGENRDWSINFNAWCETMITPKQVRAKMDGKLKERVLVHTGFYKYLFDNKKLQKGIQRYDKILDDIKTLLEPGYSIYVTGHSLGGALASMFAFKLAGENKDWLPRPITCISFASPYNGSAGYRQAFEQLEKDGFLRHLRVSNASDAVPAAPGFSFPSFRSPWRTFKHTGINLRLMDDGCKIEHSSKVGLWTAIQNNFIGPIFDAVICVIKGKGAIFYHTTSLHGDRVKANWDDLSKKTIQGLYKDENVVSKDFIKDSHHGE